MSISSAHEVLGIWRKCPYATKLVLSLFSSNGISRTSCLVIFSVALKPGIAELELVHISTLARFSSVRYNKNQNVNTPATKLYRTQPNQTSPLDKTRLAWYGTVIIETAHKINDYTIVSTIIMATTANWTHEETFKLISLWSEGII